jgi:hypothetical protein
MRVPYTLILVLTLMGTLLVCGCDYGNYQGKVLSKIQKGDGGVDKYVVLREDDGRDAKVSVIGSTFDTVEKGDYVTLERSVMASNRGYKLVHPEPEEPEPVLEPKEPNVSNALVLWGWPYVGIAISLLALLLLIRLARRHGIP